MIEEGGIPMSKSGFALPLKLHDHPCLRFDFTRQDMNGSLR